MIRLRAVFRCGTIKFNKANSRVQGCTERHFSTKQSSSSSSTSSSDDERKKLETKKKSEEARKKLSLLLNKMIQEDTHINKESKLDLAKPRNQRQKDMRKESGTKSIKTEPVVKQVVKAVKDVAESIGGDVKQTESELLQKLLNPVKEESTQSTPASLSEIFKDMKIDRETKAGEETSRATQVRQLLRQVRTTQQVRPKGGPQKRVPRQSAGLQQSEANLIEERVDLFGKEPLGIFPSAKEIANWPEQQVNKTWNTLQERELRLVVTHPPVNYFQQMILWTEQGKLWRFPIDNEQDLEKEQGVFFTKHVFLEEHLEPWCPPKGPLRHFMELVCVGLSKNPYLTVEKKKEHIEWFRDYFAEKKQLLHEVGAIPTNFEDSIESTKQIEH